MAQGDERSDSFPLKLQLHLPSFITKLFPFLKPTDAKPTVQDDSRNSNRTVVSFPTKPPAKNAEPLNFEADPSSGTTSNSLILWQVYALGGFLVFKWAWARWNERNQAKDTKDEDDDDDQPSRGHQD